MKFLDFFVNQSFKKDKDGNELFFPWGFLGKGYVLDSPETKQKVQRFLRLYNGTIFSFLLLWVVAINPCIMTLVLRPTQDANHYYPSISDSTSNFLWVQLSIFLVFMFGALLWWYIGIPPLIKKLSTTTVKFDLREAQKANVKALHPALLWFGQIASILFVLAGIFLLLQDGMPVVVGLLTVVFFGFATLAYAYMIYLRTKP